MFGSRFAIKKEFPLDRNAVLNFLIKRVLDDAEFSILVKAKRRYSKLPPPFISSYSEHVTDNLRLRAIRTFFRAKSFIFLKVVFCFNLSNPKIGISLAIHSSANELETTFTPSKSNITHSEDSIVAIKS
jgi:hypothetical protein